MRAKITRINISILLTLAAMLATLVPAYAQVKETILPNGLKVITKEVHTAPVVTFQVWYRVGSRNEQLGKTGLSHLLEHMQFKGTKTLKKGDIDALVSRNGGLMNAATSKDFTFYWETLSSDKLDLGMRIESDRMINSLIDPMEFKSEKVVVRSELEGHDNEPDSVMYYELYADAFKAHPYQWPTIGWVHDLESITRNDLYAYYKTYYAPNNATVVIVGDFDTVKALAMVNKYFGRISKNQSIPRVTALEPAQLGARTAEIRMPGNAYRVMMGYHVPAVGNSDAYTLDVLDIILSGGTSSRLYKGLVDKQLATQAWSNSGTGTDPELFMLGATARDGVKIADVQDALLAEADKMKSQPINDEELQKALNQLEAQFAYTNDSVTDQARQLGYFETIRSWRYIDQYMQNVRMVTKADVQRVAQKYLTDRNRTTITFIPENAAVPTTPAAKVSMRPILPSERLDAYRNGSAMNGTMEAKLAGKSLAAPKPSKPATQRPTRVVLDNGMVVIIQENRSNPTVAISGSLNAGSALEPSGKDGLADITAELLMRGTAKRTADQIAAQKDFVGLSLNTGAGVESATFTGHSLAKNFDTMLDLLSDTMRNPTFPDAELQKMKSLSISGLREQQEDPQSVAERAFYGTVFPAGHPYYQPSVDVEIAGISSIERDDVSNFYASHYGPGSVILVVVGDVDTGEALAKIKGYFGDWTGSAASKRVAIPDVPIQSTIERKIIPMSGKAQVSVILGYAGGLKRSSKDFYAANVMNFILGGGGALNSRLGTVIRDQMGLVYDVYSTFDATLGAGPWYASLGTNPKNVDKATEALVAQMVRMRGKGATESEVRDAVAFLTGSFPVRLETNAAVANVLHSSELNGLGMDYIRNYQKIYRSVTLEQVNAAAAKYIHPDKYTLVIAGTYKSTSK